VSSDTSAVRSCVNEPVDELQAGTCHLWWARSSDAHPKLVGLLDEEERTRANAFHHPADRQRFTVGRALTRLAVGTYVAEPPAAIVIDRTCGRCGQPHGKPRLAAGVGGIELSVSHGGERVVVACTLGSPLGVDVEPVPPRLATEELTGETLTAQEAATLDGLEDAERARAFLIYWTRKEAVAKATGKGLALTLRAFSVSPPRAPARVVAHEAGLWDGPMCLHDLNPGPGHVASLAVIGGCDRLVHRDGSALLAAW
jgi:4'-phosphopantetheinyl transferase